MKQNIYDDEEFFRGYSQLQRSVEGLAGAVEWPAPRALLPDLRGLSVLDLGCGFGWFCRWAREQGAARILGVDVSEKMLARATASTQDAAISYTLADMEQIELPAESFDLIFSSLALHYVEDLDRLMSRAQRALVNGGSFVFSVEHPILTAPARPEWSVDSAGRKSWPLTGYLEEGLRSTDWITTGVIKQHRTVASYVNTLLRHGFTLSHLEEWGPTDEQIAVRPELADLRQRPHFLLLAARR